MDDLFIVQRYMKSKCPEGTHEVIFNMSDPVSHKDALKLWNKYTGKGRKKTKGRNGSDYYEIVSSKTREQQS